jgi:hypothetical protein
MPSDVESPRCATALHELRRAVVEPDDGSLLPARAAAGWAPAAGEDAWPDGGAGRLEPASEAAFVAAGAENAPDRPAEAVTRTAAAATAASAVGAAARAPARLVLGAA